MVCTRLSQPAWLDTDNKAGTTNIIRGSRLLYMPLGDEQLKLHSNTRLVAVHHGPEKA